jgi:DNA adenine methylase
MQVTSFGGMGSQFGIDYARPRWNLTRIVPLLEDVHERLAGVLIERLSYGDCIRRYDSRPGTLFYCDPPYWGCVDDYGKGAFSEADFERLSTLLEGIQGRFILSLNDTPEVRKIFARFVMEEVQLNYRLSGKVTPARELLISGPCQ